jgi:hypothetical protein
VVFKKQKNKLNVVLISHLMSAKRRQIPNRFCYLVNVLFENSTNSRWADVHVLWFLVFIEGERVCV